jgi:hypothetical protein
VRDRLAHRRPAPADPDPAGQVGRVVQQLDLAAAKRRVDLIPVPC